MRKPLVALAGFLLVSLSLIVAAPAFPQQTRLAAASPAAAAGAGVQIEDPAIPAGDRDVLARAAQQVGRWAMIQRVVQAVKAQEAAPPAMERVRAIDEAWQRGEDPDGLATSLAKNDCAQALQTLMSANPGYGEAYVTDHQGAIVCMTDRTSDYWQGDEEAWTRAYGGGAGAVVVGKTERDATTGLEVVPISVPVKSAGQVIGVLTVQRIAAPPAHASPG
jgi:hypothetical protein